MSAQLSASPAAAPGIRARRITRAAAVGLGALGAVLVWVIADPLLGVDFSVTSSGTTTVVGPGLIVGMAVLFSLLGWGLLAVLERFSQRARVIWTTVAVVVTLLSLVMPFNSGEAETAAKWSLLVMHLVVAAAVIPLFARTVHRTA